MAKKKTQTRPISSPHLRAKHGVPKRGQGSSERIVQEVKSRRRKK